MAEQWTVGEVSTWLKDNDLQEYLQAFIGEAFDGCILSVSTVLHEKTNV